MFSSFKLPSLRPRSRSFSNAGAAGSGSECSLLHKPPKTPVGSPKQKHHRKRNSEIDPGPVISSLRPGSVALQSDQLVAGDRIYSVNGITTTRMKPEEVTTLLDNVDGNALLEVEYSLPNYASQNSLCVTSKVTEVTVESVDGSLGITLRGGSIPEHPSLSRPLVITQIRPNGPAHRTGLVRVGDRLLKVDHHSLVNKTLLEAQQILKENSSHSSPHGITLTTLTIEYDVSVMESVKYANGPLLVEIDRQLEEDFGLVLTNCIDLGPDDILAAGYYIESMVPASTADRCGALNIGDQVLAIDDLVLDGWSGTPGDAERLLRRATKLQILPSHAIQRVPSRNYGNAQYANSPSVAGFSTLNSRRSRNNRNRSNRQSTIHKSFDSDCGSNYCGCTGNLGVSHPETLSVTLTADRGLGYGLGVSVGDHSENRSADILISRITPDSPAYRCGCLQVGDRIISVNHQPNLTLQEIHSILEMGNETNSKVTLQVEFDVTDTIVPSSGVFTVKLAKRGSGLGITITACKARPEEPFIISEIRRGSIAHRTGTLHAGDRLLAIDNRTLDHMSLESAFDILQTSTNDIVTLKVEKTETENANLFLDSVVYTVELHRYGGPLGITISGSEDCLDPIVLSRLTEGGLAEKTGALHVGDRILAINGESLEHRPLSDAIRLLQTSGDRVQLKIARNIKSSETSEDSRCNYSSPGLMSVDSAIHSWDSNTVDNQPDNATDIHEIKDIESVLSEPLSYLDGDKTATKKHQRDSQLQFYSDTEEIFCPSPLPLPNYNFTNTIKYENYTQSPAHFNAANSFNSSNSFTERAMRSFSHENMLDNEVYHVTLYKDSIYDDYGFSVSDGLYEKGVYVNRIRKGGPADIVGLLKPYDRIIQVNDTKTQDFDCCLTVPLIASAGDRIELVIARNPYLNIADKDVLDNISKKSFSASQNTITKTL
ncbi:glutamate receptor-interacting protein 2 isoform X2 [Aethina tumida]|uniref:glutamate receptor-interacting protein 2 isoform X2 n=1 Tax=Aethina tumida TaxID=116153 RepID=UPI00096B51C0|nr:glutamate receptor-interacting protein 2 isoform X2 [Aethina tumida]